MRQLYYVDTETVGFTGPIVIIQYAFGDEDPIIHHVWVEPAGKTLRLIEKIMDAGIIDFNGAFDQFQLVKLYNMLKFIPEDELPIDHIDDLAMAEPDARFGVCLKPRHALDLMCHARKGPYQSTMERDDIRIKRIPTPLARLLVDELTKRIPFKKIYFAKSASDERWHIEDSKGCTDNTFKDVVLKFRPSTRLKDLAEDAFGETVTHYDEIAIPSEYKANETLYAPFAMACVKEQLWDAAKTGGGEFDEEGFDYHKKPASWMGTWPDVIKHHVNHWFNPTADLYARNDIVYLQKLDKLFEYPALDDQDSVLAHMIGAVRWSGYNIDLPYTRALRKTYKDAVDGNSRFNASHVCRKYLEEVMSPTEKMVLITENKDISTAKLILAAISEWKTATVCKACRGEGCEKCAFEGLVMSGEEHPAATRAKEISEYRQAKHRLGLLEKLLVGGRFHASLNVIGALSGRMSGEDDFNPQGVNRAKEMRKCFILKDPWEDLNSGDIDGAEVCIAEAVYNDENLRADLKAGKKIHAILGTFCFPPNTYDQIRATEKHNDPMQDLYSRSKQGTFALLYGGDAGTLARRVGIPIEQGGIALTNFQTKYKRVGEARERIYNMFCSMRQPGGIGSKVEWHDPADCIKTMFGFPRYYTMENRICKCLFELAEDPPKFWLTLDFKVVRRDRSQLACNATRSALFGAAFGVQAAAMRSAANHEIQGTCSQVNKGIEVDLWALQPIGVHPFVVKPLNVHDETQCPTDPAFTDATSKILADYTIKMREFIPLFSIEWKTRLKDWADK